MPTSDGRAYVAGIYAIDVDGNFAGWVQSAEGGHASSDVVQEKMGPDKIVRKHIAGVKYDEISIGCGTGMTSQFYDWIKASFDHTYMRKDGAIIAANYNFQEMTRLSFFRALVTEVAFPALDGASKDAAKMTIKFKPEMTRMTTSLGGGPKIQGTFDSKVQKQWSPANFRIKIDGLDDACGKVNKVEALTLKQKVIENAVGEERDYSQEPATLEIPNLVVTFPESHAEGFYKWFEDFVIKGNNGDGQEKTATIEYLSQNRQTTLFTITLKHIGIFKLTPDKAEAGGEGLKRVKAEMYCEEMNFTYGSTSKWA